METCENCGKSLGKLETAHVWGEHVVCGNCLPALVKSPRKSTSLKIVAIFTILSIAVILAAIGGFWMRGGRSQAERETKNPISSSKIPVGFVEENKKQSISGAIWINRSDGTTNILRGHPIYLLSMKVKRLTISAFYEKHYDEARTYSEQYVEVAKGTRDLAKLTYVPRSKLDSMTEILGKLTNDLKLLNKLRANIPDESTVPAICASVNKLNYFSSTPMEIIIRDDQIKNATTNIDGKYIINDIPQGEYCLCSYFAADFGELVWAIPVRVSNADSVIDLHNNNTVSIAN